MEDDGARTLAPAVVLNRSSCSGLPSCKPLRTPGEQEKISGAHMPREKKLARPSHSKKASASWNPRMPYERDNGKLSGECEKLFVSDAAIADSSSRRCAMVVFVVDSKARGPENISMCAMNLPQSVTSGLATLRRQERKKENRRRHGYPNGPSRRPPLWLRKLVGGMQRTLDITRIRQ